MSKFKYSDGEQQINNVLNYQAQELKSSRAFNVLICLEWTSEYQRVKNC